MTSIPTAEPRILVPLRDLGLAPENLRFDEPEDEGVPRLAETIRAAGLIYPPIVRKGRRGEAAFMVLDGRRRRFALLRLVDAGLMSLDDEVECALATGKAAQAAAAVLTNSEHAPVHLADVIVAIGKLRRSRMDTAAIAGALGYDELEIRRLAALAAVHPIVLAAYRQGKLTLRQVRLFARLPNRRRQEELAQSALDGYLHDHHLLNLVRGDQVTVEDVRLLLVGRAGYADAGGRLSADLFGEFPEVVLDVDVLDRAWAERAVRLAAPLAEAGLAVHVTLERSWGAPEGLVRAYPMSPASLPEADREAYAAACARQDAAEQALSEPADPSSDVTLTEALAAASEAAQLAAGAGAVEAVLLTPDWGVGLQASFFVRPPPVAASEAMDDGQDGGDDLEDEDADPDRFRAPAPDIAPVPVVAEPVLGAHALHELVTDVATRALIRDLADRPQAALVAVTAQLFKLLALRDPVGPDASALHVKAQAFARVGGCEIPALDGVVRARLAARREAYLGSGRRPIAWVAGLPADHQLTLLAELVAVSLNLREGRSDMLRRAARAEAQEIAALCEADPARHWTPDEPFLAAHSKVQLLGFLEAMDAADETARGLKKDELVRRVAEAAAEQAWVPDAVRFQAPRTDTESPEAEPSASGEEPETPLVSADDGAAEPAETPAAPEAAVSPDSLAA